MATEHAVHVGTGISRRLPDRRRTWGENVRTVVQTHQATCAGVRGRACGQLCGQLCGRMYGQDEGVGAAQCRYGIKVLGLASHFSHWPARRGRARAFAAAACVANAAAAIERIAFWL